jgi:hypothetical protein
MRRVAEGERVKKKHDPHAQARTVALWVLAFSGWAVVLCTNNTIGVEAFWGRTYRVFDPPPEEATQIVVKLDRDAAKHNGHAPLELRYAGVSSSERVRYMCLHGGEYELKFAVDGDWDDVWTYTSWNRKWSHWKMSSSGG